MSRSKITFFSPQEDELRGQYMHGKRIMPVPHIHQTYELYFCPDNIEQNFVICGVDYKYFGPCIIISKPYTIHSMSCTEDCATDYKRTVFYFGEHVIKSLGVKNFPSEISEGKMSLLFKLTVEDANKLDILIDNGFDFSENGSAYENELLFAMILKRICRLYTGESRLELGNAEYYVERVMKFITENLSSSMDVSEIAARFAVSRSKLDRDFRAAIGVTPKAFIEECRLNFAKSLLLNDPRRTVSEISLETGFVSENYFYRFFKKKTGLSPSEYKKSKNIY